MPNVRMYGMVQWYSIVATLVCIFQFDHPLYLHTAPLLFFQKVHHFQEAV